jgi:acyl-CoA thioester hydrolase
MFMSAFRFHHRLQARFGDCDLFGHVNNAVYFTYMEEARWAYWRTLTGDSGQDRVPGLILARAECDFLRPVRPGERIDIWLGATRIGRSSMSIDCEMLDEHDGAVARGKAVMVTYDYGTAKPVSVPDWCRASIEAYEGRNLSRAQFP